MTAPTAIYYFLWEPIYSVEVSTGFPLKSRTNPNRRSSKAKYLLIPRLWTTNPVTALDDVIVGNQCICMSFRDDA